MFLQTPASLSGSHIHKQNDTNTGSAPSFPQVTEPTLQIGKWFLKYWERGETKVKLLSLHLEKHSSVFLLCDPPKLL